MFHKSGAGLWLSRWFNQPSLLPREPSLGILTNGDAQTLTTLYTGETIMGRKLGAGERVWQCPGCQRKFAVRRDVHLPALCARCRSDRELAATLKEGERNFLGFVQRFEHEYPKVAKPATPVETAGPEETDQMPDWGQLLGTDGAEEMPAIGAVPELQEPPGPPALPEAPDRQRWTGFTVGLTASLTAFGILLLILAGITLGRPDGMPDEESVRQQVLDQVRAHLKTAKTAEFLDDLEVRRLRQPKATDFAWKGTGHVDRQNKFGTFERVPYEIEIGYDVGYEMWIVEYIRADGEDLYLSPVLAEERKELAKKAAAKKAAAEQAEKERRELMGNLLPGTAAEQMTWERGLEMAKQYVERKLGSYFWSPSDPAKSKGWVIHKTSNGNWVAYGIARRDDTRHEVRVVMHDGTWDVIAFKFDDKWIKGSAKDETAGKKPEADPPDQMGNLLPGTEDEQMNWIRGLEVAKTYTTRRIGKFDALPSDPGRSKGWVIQKIPDGNWFVYGIARRYGYLRRIQVVIQAETWKVLSFKTDDTWYKGTNK